MANISQIQVGTTTYDIADATARTALANYQSNVLIPVDYSSSGFSQFTNGAIGIGGTNMTNQPTFITKAPAGNYYGYYRFCLTTAGHLRVDGCQSQGGTWTTIGYVQLNDTATVLTDTGQPYRQQIKTKSSTSFSAALPNTASSNDYTNDWLCYDSNNTSIGYAQTANTKEGVYRSFAVTNPRTNKTTAMYLENKDDGTRQLTTNQVDGTYAKWHINAIPDIPATKITGTLAAERLPSIPAAKITGTLAAGNIPSIAGSKINAGTINPSYIGKMFKIADHTSSKFTVNSGTSGQGSVNMTESGWDFIGVVGIQTNHSNVCSINEYQRNSTTSATVRLRNNGSSNLTDCTVTVRGLYTKANLY